MAGLFAAAAAFGYDRLFAAVRLWLEELMPAKKPATRKSPAKRKTPVRKNGASLVDLEKRVKALEENQSIPGALIENLDTQLRVVAEGQDMVSDRLHKEMEELKKALHSLDESLTARVTLLEVGHTKLEQGQAKLEQGQAKLEQGQAKLEQGLGQVEQGLVTVSRELARLADAIERMRQGNQGVLENHEQRIVRLEAAGGRS